MKDAKGQGASRLHTVLYYGLAICTAGGTGGFIWQQSKKLDQETLPLPAAPILQTSAPDPDPEPKVSISALPPVEDPSKKPSSKGEIVVKGRAGTSKTIAPATDRDRTASVKDNLATPSYQVPAAGATFYVAEDPNRAWREEQSRRNEENRQAQKRAEDSDPMWQKRVNYKR